MAKIQTCKHLSFSDRDRDEFHKLAPHWEIIITGLFSGNAVFLIKFLLHHQTKKKHLTK